MNFIYQIELKGTETTDIIDSLICEVTAIASGAGDLKDIRIFGAAIYDSQEDSIRIDRRLCHVPASEEQILTAVQKEVDSAIRENGFGKCEPIITKAEKIYL